MNKTIHKRIIAAIAEDQIPIPKLPQTYLETFSLSYQEKPYPRTE
ncbi:hypothetical protein [Candidatus Contubernalis alkaliaceticus]|nr:hypothetical protein [Candidatus Contubernalis alkalaceticus]